MTKTFTCWKHAGMHSAVPNAAPERVGSVAPVNIFHIVSTEAWAAAAAHGSYQPESLATEGFIHFSSAEQVAATANRYYRELDGLQLLEVDPDRLTAEVRVERSPITGELFPHLYGALPVGAVVAIHPLRRNDTGSYVF